jgi:threonine dehydrogenase-like Zn-dependent dehydrogenase
MKAACYYGKEDIRVERVPDPQILNPRDAIVKVTATAICGSDLHIYDGYIPTMERGDILGHEFMGEVVEVGRGNDRLKVGDRVVVPFTIACEWNTRRISREPAARCEPRALGTSLHPRHYLS